MSGIEEVLRIIQENQPEVKRVTLTGKLAQGDFARLRDALAENPHITSIVLPDWNLDPSTIYALQNMDFSENERATIAIEFPPIPSAGTTPPRPR